MSESRIKKHIREMSAYKPPLEGRSKDDFVLLDFNERTVPVATHVADALRRYLDRDVLQVYPSYGDFVEKLARYVGRPATELMITNGSDQGLDLVIRAVATPGSEIVIPSPCFAIYAQSARIEDLKIVEPSYSIDDGLPAQRLIDAVTDRTSVIVVPNPNNPTGTLIPATEIAKVVRACPNVTVLVDECYFEYTDCTVADLVAEHPNLFITRTFSKTWGLPSLRLGYIISCEQNIEDLLKVRGPYDINTLAVIAASAALDDPSYMKAHVNEVLQQSKPLFESFLEDRGIRYWPTSANFVLAYFDSPETVAAELQRSGILVRPKADAAGTLCLRITLGTKSQTERLIQALDKLL